jgi:heme A synthase
MTWDGSKYIVFAVVALGALYLEFRMFAHGETKTKAAIGLIMFLGTAGLMGWFVLLHLRQYTDMARDIFRGI